MRLCLRCRRLSPSGSAFCRSGCGAFGGTRCPLGHVTPGSAARCPACGSAELVPEAPSLGLGLVPRALGWCAAVLALRYAIWHLREGLGLALAAAGWLLGGHILGFAWSALSFLLALKVFAWGVGLFDADLAKRLDPGPKLLPAIWKATAKTASLAARLLLWAVEGKALPKPERKAKPKRREES